MTKKALQIVQEFQQSIERGTDDWQNLFAEDVIFKGPVDTVIGKKANIELNKNFFPLVKEYKPKTHFEQGKWVCLEGTFVVNTPAGNTLTMDMAEIYEIVDEKIQNMRVYYDAEEFRKEFSKVLS